MSLFVLAPFLLGRGRHEPPEELAVPHQVIERVDGVDTALLHENDPVAAAEDVQLVRGQDPALVPEEPADGVVHDVAADVGIDGGERVIHEDDIGVEVDGTGDVQALLLAPGHRDAALADLRPVPVWKHLEVGSQGAGVDDPVVPLLVVLLAEQDVVPDRRVLDPGGLRTEGPRCAHPCGSLGHPHIASESREQGGLSTPHGTDNRQELVSPHGEGQIGELEGFHGRPTARAIVGFLLRGLRQALVLLRCSLLRLP